MKQSYTIAFLILSGIICSGMVFAMENPVNIHGFISQSYLQTDKNNFIDDSEDGTFQFNEMGINFTNEPIEKLRIGMQFFAQDYGSVGNDAIILDWAYADYRFFDFLGVRGGLIKNAVGLYMEVRDLDMLRVPVFLPNYEPYLRNTANSTQGIGIYGDINTDRFGSLGYQVAVGTANIPKENSGEALYLGLGQFDITSVEMDTILSGALVYSDPTGMVRLSYTAYLSDLAADGTVLGAASVPVHYDMTDIEIYLGSFEFTWNNFMFVYERYWSYGDLKVFINSFSTGLQKRSILQQYWLVSYRINDIFSVSYYYAEHFDDETDRKGRRGAFYADNPAKAWHKESTFSLRCDLNANWIFKVQYHYTDGASKLLEPLNPDGIDRYWHMWVTKLSYNF